MQTDTSPELVALSDFPCADGEDLLPRGDRTERFAA